MGVDQTHMTIVPKRLGVKFSLKHATSLQPAATVPIFQRWIQDATVPGMLIDVIDYKHVPDGPGIILIADEGDYAYDLSDGETGLNYIRKRGLGEDLSAALNLAFRHAIIAARQLESEVDDINFDISRAKISFIDRQHYRNTPERYAAIEDDLRASLVDIFGVDVSIHRRYDDPRELLCVTATASQPIVSDAILARLAATDPL